MPKRRVEEFKARSDDGSVHSIVHYEHQTDISNQDSSSRELMDTGIAEYILKDGRSLNVKDDTATVFEVVQTGKILRRI